MQQRAHVVGAILALGGLTVACTPDPPPPPPPTLTASPPETELERQERAFASAEESYRAFRAEFDRLSQLGYSGEPTPKMKQYAGGPYLEAFSGFLKQNDGSKSQGSVGIAYVRRASYTPRELKLAVCEDGRRVRNYNAKGKYVDSGVVVKLTIVARPMNNRWIIWDGFDKQVKTCDDSS